MPSVLFFVKAMTVSPLILLKRGRGKENRVRRGVAPRHVRRGWLSNLGGPCLSTGDPDRRRTGKSTPKLARSQTHVLAAEFARQNKRLSWGRPKARGTEVAAEGGKEVAAKLRLASASEPKVPRGEPYMSFEVGELAGNSDLAEQRGLVLM